MANFHIFMVGGRRCGKTTVLSKISDNFDAVLHHGVGEGDTLFRLTYNPSRINHLNKAKDAIYQIFRDHDFNASFPVDYNRTPNATTTPFMLNVCRQRLFETSLEIFFHDIPGEWCMQNREVTDVNFAGKTVTQDCMEFVKEYAHGSQVIIIAIDTPALMENDGALNETINSSNNISEAIKAALFDSRGYEAVTDKLILFIPLKCEQFILRGANIDREHVNQLSNKIRAAYRPLLDTIQQAPFNQNVVASIIPIITIKELRWKSFGCVVNGEVFDNITYIDETGNRKYRNFPVSYDPANLPFSYFGFSSYGAYTNAYNNGSQSLYCEQPLIYALTYLFANYLYRRKTPAQTPPTIQGFFRDIINKIGGIWGSIQRDESLYRQEIERLRRKMEWTDLIIQDKNNFL